MVCLEVERIAPEVTASILEVDAQGLLHPLAGPSLPQSYSALLDGVAIGPNVGLRNGGATRRCWWTILHMTRCGRISST
jgi:hypothetical protein